MPGNIPDSAILPNDWQEGKITTSDTFWKIDVSTGKKERLVDPEKIGAPMTRLILFFLKTKNRSSLSRRATENFIGWGYDG